MPSWAACTDLRVPHDNVEAMVVAGVVCMCMARGFVGCGERCNLIRITEE